MTAIHLAQLFGCWLVISKSLAVASSFEWATTPITQSVTDALDRTPGYSHEMEIGRKTIQEVSIGKRVQSSYITYLSR